jgi:hypothetical protein
MSKEEMIRGSAPAPVHTTSTSRFPTTMPSHRRSLPPATMAGQRRTDDMTTERRREHQLLIQRAVAPWSSPAPAIGANDSDQEARLDLGARSKSPLQPKPTGKQQTKTNYLLPRRHLRHLRQAVAAGEARDLPGGENSGYCSREGGETRALRNALRDSRCLGSPELRLRRAATSPRIS